MSTPVRSLTTLVALQAIAVLNALRLDLLKLRAGVVFHADAAPAAVTTTNATDLPSSIALITALQVFYTTHIASACDVAAGTGAHTAADVTNVLAAPVPTDLASCETAANELKTEFNLHCAMTSAHAVADATNTVSTAAATNLSTTEALANALKTNMNAHAAAAFTHAATALVAP